MNGRWLKLYSMLLVLCMTFNMMPMSSFAAELSKGDISTNPTADEQIETDVALEAEEIIENRTEYTKSFRLNNGLYMAVVYPEAVHFETEDGWKEIDNTLVSESGAYTNTAGVWDVSFPQQLTTDTNITITKDGYTLSFNVAGKLQLGSFSASNGRAAGNEEFTLSTAEASNAEPQEIDISSEQESAEIKEAVPENLQSRVLYEDVFQNTDIIYDLDSNKVKESIVIEQYDNTLQGYRYTLNTDGMIPVLEESGQILFYDEKQENVIMVMPVPYLVDANNEYNDDIQVTLTGENSQYTLSYLLPRQWLAAEERAWPVVLDPIVTPQISTSNIKDRTVAERDVYSVSSGTLECGYSTEDGIERIYLQYVGLPDLTGSEVVVRADLGMCKVGDSAVEVPVEVHKVNGVWDSNTITWSNKPAHNSLVEDYVMVKNQGAYFWNVTNIVRGWYESGNTGMMFKLPDADEQSGTNNWKQFRSSDFSDYEDSKPTLYIYYRHNNGIEPYYSYQTMSAGASGTAYVADATGQLKVATPIASYSSEVNPFSLGLVYNSDYFAQNPNANDPIQSTHGLDMYFGRGFTLDIVQTIEPADLDNAAYDYLVYHDGDGTDHYFAKQDDGTYLDEDGLGLTVTVSGSNYTMTDDQGNTWTFTNGILTEQKDEYGNKIRIAWQKSSAGYWFNAIYQQNAGQTEIPLVTVTYKSGTSYVETITDAAGRIFRFAYDSDYRLIGIYQQGSQNAETETHIAKYDYSGRRLIGMRDMVTGYQLWYEYSGGKISSIQEWTHSNYSGSRMDVTYKPEQTIYHDYGVDCAKDTEDDLWTYYSFDYWGRTVNACTKDSTGKVLGASTAELSGSGGDSGNLRTNNRTERTASTGTIAQNLLANGNFETNNSGWSFSGTDATASLTRSQYTAHTGRYSLQGWVGENHNSSLGAYTTIKLTAGTTYTFSAFVDTSWISSFGQGGIRLLAYNNQGDSWQSDYLDHDTTGINSNWEQISVTFTPTTTGNYNLMIQAVGAKGWFYVDDVQLEVGSAPSNYNLVCNGNMATAGGWQTQGSVGYTTSGGNQVLSMAGKPTANTCAWQNVWLMQPGTQTYVLSGWAWADSVPDNDDPSKNENYANDNVKRFGLQAIVVYNDEAETREYHYVPFCPDVHSWQYTSLTIVPKEPTKTVKYIQVVCAYEKNANAAWFDDISLVVEPAQTMRYDEEGNLISVSTTGLEDQTATYENGNLIQSYTGGSGTYNYKYNEDKEHQLDSVDDGVVKQTYGYDEFGNVTSTTIQKENGTGKTMSTSAVYTDNGNLLLTVTDANGNVVNYSYSDGISTTFGLPTTVSNASGQTVTNTYDDFGRVINSSTDKVIEEAVENLGNIAYTYSSDGVMTKITRNGSQEYLFTYDVWDRMTSVTVGGRTLATYEYAPNNGQLLSQTYGNGDKVSYAYDMLGRVVKVTYTSAAGDVTREITNTYNGNGQLYSIHDSATGQTLRCVYDSLGRLLSVDSDDVRESYTYNAFNQLTRYSFVSPILGSGTQTYTYDTDSGNSISDGMLRSMTMVNSHGIGYLYDDLQRLSYRHINNGKSGGGMWERYVYKYDNEENTTTSQVYEKRIWLNDTFVTNAFLYAYDENGNIVTETRHAYTIPTSSQGTQPNDAYTETTTSYTYDALGQLTKVEHNNDWTESYTYDNAGNILTFDNGSGIHHEMSYNDSQWEDLLTGVDNNAITYDAIGNPLTYYNGYTFTWTEGRRLQSVTTGENQTTTYLYDANGLRLRKTNPDGSYIQYHLSDGRYLGETRYNAQNQRVKYIRYTYDESNSIIGIGVWYAGHSQSWEEYYFEKNLQGDVIAIYTATNGENGLPELVASYTYDSWGNILSATGELAEINPFRYRSYYYDAETNFYYLQSRYYNPEIGRFINADDVSCLGANGDFASVNLFVYCGNNPVIRTDYSGRLWETIFDIITLGVSIVDVCSNPTDPWAWVGLVGDTVDLIPFVAGVGEAARTMKTIDKVADAADATYDIAKTANRVDKVIDTSASSFRYTDKVLHQMNNASDLRHSFPSIIDSLVDTNAGRAIKGGDSVVRNIVEVPGSINGADGVFEYIIEPNGLCNHRFFREFR